MADGTNSGRVTNRAIYGAVGDLRKELGDKIDSSRDKIADVDKSLCILETKVDSMASADKKALDKAEALEKEVSDMKLANARSNKVAAGIAAGVSAAINTAVTIWQAMK